MSNDMPYVASVLRASARHQQRPIQCENLVDVIFLDVDGVILPFGGDKDGYSKSEQSCTINGCIFPDRIMDELTTLLERINNITFDDDRPSSSSSNEKINCCTSCCGCDGPSSPSRIQGNPVFVLSSTWRARPEFISDILSSLRAYATKKGLENIWENHIQSFFDITDPYYHTTRSDEVYRWIQSHTTDTANKAANSIKKTKKQQYTIRSWIALDDEELVHVEGRVVEDALNHAVKTTSHVGLTSEDVELAVHLVEKQIREYHGIES